MTAEPTAIAAPPRELRRALHAVAPAGEPHEGTLVGEERFAAYIAHELRTPLATQRALLELTLSDPLANRVSWRDVAEEVLDACLQQERLLEGCLTLARSRYGPTREDRIDLTAIACEAICTNDRAGLECVLRLEPAVIWGDALLVERLVANLVSNAIRHNLPGGRLEVATRTRSGRAFLVVANSGPPISAAELRRLFQPFQRLDSGRQPASHGIGLGLPIVQAIADSHNAGLAAEALPDGGLEVEICFPAGPRL